MEKETIVFSKPKLTEDVTVLDARISSFRYNLHAHDDYAIGMTLEGEQCFECSGKDYVSKYHFIRSFKKVTNRTPYQYILDLKMEWVRKELEAGLAPIDIADKFGFHDLSHLIDVFAACVCCGDNIL